MNGFAKILFRTSSVLVAFVIMQRASFASVDDAQSFALQAAEPYVKQGFQVREDYWGGDLASGEKKAVRQQLFKGTNIGSGWEQKSIGRRYPFTFTIPMENWQRNQIAGRKAILRLRTSFQRLPVVTLSSSAWRNRRRNARIGRWCMDSGRSGLVALALANTPSARR